MQAHVRVCKENKLEELEEKNDAYWNSFAVTEGSYKKSGEMCQDDILKGDSPLIA